MSKLPNKLIGIQWIRAIAILAVLGFHLFPETFPNGYLGVDIFFVISGYLMTKITYNLLETLTLKEVIKTFYHRRFVRICPNYFFTVFYVMMIGISVLRFSDFEYLQQDSLWASFFATNLKRIIEQQSYFKLTSSFKPLLHTWSLGVEIQFYLLAPLLFYILYVFSKRIYLVIGLITLSISYQMFLGRSPEAFELVFCRLWQFLIGSLAFYNTMNNVLVVPLTVEKNDEELSEKNRFEKSTFKSGLLTTLFIIIICFCPINVTEFGKQFMLRSFITLLTGYLILQEDFFLEFKDKMSNKVMVYIGDASYSIYLAHWPIIVFSRYYGYDTFYYGPFLIIFAVVVYSVVQYELFEKFLLNRSSLHSTISVCICLIGIWFIASIKRPIEDNNVSTKIYKAISIEQAIQMNQELHSECQKFSIPCNKDKIINETLHALPPDDSLQGRCVVHLNNTGNRIAVVMGNSYVARHSKMILEALTTSEFGDQFGEFYVVNRKVCPSFDSTLDGQSPSWECPSGKGLMLNFLGIVKPDLLILLNRLDHVPGFNTEVTLLNNDTVTNKLTEDLIKMANFSGEVIILQDHLMVGNTNKAVAITLSQLLATNQNISGLTKPRKEVDNELKNAWLKMKAAASHCHNCHVLEVRDLYCNAETCDLYDSKNNLAYFCDGSHFTNYGTQKILPSLRKKIDEVLNLQNAKTIR